MNPRAAVRAPRELEALMGLPARNRSASFSLLSSGVVILAAAACGGGMSPSTGDSPGQGRGATLVGTVEIGAGAASVQAGAASAHAFSSSGRSGIRVTVVGTSVSTTTDENGRFVLTGLPSGRVDIRFESPALDAQVEITGLVDGQTLTITFQISGGRVQVVGPGNEGGDDDDDHEN